MQPNQLLVLTALSLVFFTIVSMLALVAVGYSIWAVIILTVFILSCSFFVIQKTGIVGQVTASWHQLLKTNPASMCDLESAISNTCLFITKDGGLATVIYIEGLNAMPGDETFKTLQNSIYNIIKTAFTSNKNTEISYFFERTPELVAEDMHKAYQPNYATSARLNMNVRDILNEDITKLSKFTRRERTWVVIYTSTNILGNNYKQVKQNAIERIFSIFSEGLPKLKVGRQNPLKYLQEVSSAHMVLVKDLSSNLMNRGFTSEIVSVDEAMREMRKMVALKLTPDNWLPKWCDEKKFADAEDLPLLPGFQIVPVDIHEENDFVKIEDKYYAPLAMEIGPRNVKDFLEFFYSLDDNIPYRLVIRLKEGGLASISLKRQYVGFLGFMGDNNRRIRDAIHGIAGLSADGDLDIGFQCHAITWAQDVKTLKQRMTTLSSALSSWGGGSITPKFGDAIEAFFSNIPGYMRGSPSNKMVINLSDVIPMLPIVRPASPWRLGDIHYRTPDGKPFPVQIMATNMDTWNTLIFAPPGSGKSFIMNSENFAFCLGAGLTQLPQMFMIDIGVSSMGLISLLRDALPEDKKHLVNYYRLQNTPEYGINIFSTPLGCRTCGSQQKALIVEFISLLATDPNTGKTPAWVANIASILVTSVYEAYSDMSNIGHPKEYMPGQDPQIDEYFSKNQIVPENKSSWWSVVDVLFAKGEIKLAAQAQEYAVPTLSEISYVLGTQTIKDLFDREGEQIKTNSGQSIKQFMGTTISTTVDNFPMLAGISKLNIGDTRIISFDLNDVTGGSDPISCHKTAIMYSLSLQFVTKRFYIDETIYETCPNIYHSFHKNRQNDIKSERKAVVCDEFHRTGGVPALRHQFLQIMREGRKWNVRVILASQFLSDFDENMVNSATSVYIMKTPNKTAALQAQKLFGLSSVATERMENELLGPTEKGAPFLGMYKTKKGVFTQILVNTAGAVKRWALTTEAEDMRIRDELYEYEGNGIKVRQLLAKRYPNGTAREELLAIEKGLGAGSHTTPVQVVINELKGQL